MKKQLICAALAAMSTMTVFAAVKGKIIRDNDSVVEGTINYNKHQGVYEVQSGKVSQVVKLAEVKSLDIPKPEALDKAIKAVEEGKGSTAVASLTKITTEYKMLDWDKVAARYLVKAHLSAGDAKKAIDAAEAVIKDDPDAAFKGAMASEYWKALLELNKMTDLDKCLKAAVKKGDRASAAAAKVLEGDKILKKAGVSPSQDVLKQALTDSYLRVVLMYNDEPCKAARKDALLGAANCFEKMGHATRAANLRDEANAL